MELTVHPLVKNLPEWAKEDPRFYQHNGFDLKGIIRAAVNNAIHGKVVEGGSTITQQIATSLFLTRERRPRRSTRGSATLKQVRRAGLG